MAWPFDLLNRAAKFPTGSDEWNLLQALCQAANKSGGASGPAGGVLNGTYPNPGINANPDGTIVASPSNIKVGTLLAGNFTGAQTPGFVLTLVGATPTWLAVSPGAYPVSDAIFAVNDNVDPTKLLNVQAAGQATGTTTTIRTSATVSRPFGLPDISGTGVVQEDVTGFVFLGANVQLHSENARVQLSSLVANGAQFRGNQYGANTGAPGISTFKSRGLAIGALGGVLAGDILFRATSVGVAPNNVSIPLAGLITIQVPLAFVPAAQNWVPSEYELQLVPLAGPIDGQVVVAKVTSEGETRTLRGIRAGGPATPASNTGDLSQGTLWSSGAGSPEGAIQGAPGDLWSDTTAGALYAKQTGVATTGWMLLGSGVSTTPYACPAGVAVGDVVYLTGSDAVDKASSASVATVPAIGFVAAKPTPTTCVVRYHDEQSGFLGLTPGATYYVSPTTAGAITAVAPGLLGQVIQRVGFARNPTTMVVFVDRDFDVL